MHSSHVHRITRSFQGNLVVVEHTAALGDRALKIAGEIVAVPAVDRRAVAEFVKGVHARGDAPSDVHNEESDHGEGSTDDDDLRPARRNAKTRAPSDAIATTNAVHDEMVNDSLTARTDSDSDDADLWLAPNPNHRRRHADDYHEDENDDEEEEQSSSDDDTVEEDRAQR